MVKEIDSFSIFPLPSKYFIRHLVEQFEFPANIANTMKYPREGEKIDFERRKLRHVVCRPYAVKVRTVEFIKR